MPSKTEICNMALAHLGRTKPIANLNTENSAEATACRVFYTAALKEVLRDFNWPFATKEQELSLIEEDPTDEWGFAYQYPSQCVYLRRIFSGMRTDTRDTEVPYKLVRSSTGQYIYTDMEDAIAEYTVLHEDPHFYPPDFVMALSFKIAFLVTPAITSGDPFQKRTEMAGLYDYEILKAVANAKSEQKEDVEPDSSFGRSRL
jgi:hypothetical protein